MTKPTAEYCKATIAQIDAYLSGTLSGAAAAAWALKILCSRDYERLPQALRGAIHVLCDLHDKPTDFWFPTNEELLQNRSCVEQLLQMEGGMEGAENV